MLGFWKPKKPKT